MRTKKARHNRSLFILSFTTAIVTFSLFLPSLQNAFVNWDDDAYIYANPHIHILNARFLRWAFFDFYAANYHPLTWMSHALDYMLWGLNPLGHHLTSIILHSVNTFLVVLLVAALRETHNHPFRKGDTQFTFPVPRFAFDKKTLIAATTTGLLFGLHPLHVESVAWISERKDVLCGLFFLLALLSYTNYAEASDEKERPEYFRRHYLFTTGFFILALLSKPMAVTLPAVLLVLDWYPFERIRSFKTFRAAFVEKLPFFGLSLAFSVVSVLSQRSGKAIISMEHTPLSARFAVAAETIFSYMGKMVLPVNLVPFYQYPEDVSLFSPKYLVFIVLAIGVSAACLAVMKKQKVWLAAWSYYLITLLPVIGIIQVGFQAKADRYTYLPSLGPLLIIGLAAAWVYEKTAEEKKSILGSVVTVATAALIILMSYATVKQIGIWKNSLVLWNYVIETKSEKSAVAYYHRGIAYYDLRQLDLAIQDYSRAVSLKSDYDEAYNNRAVVYNEKGDTDLAIEDFNKAISLNPHYKIYANRGDAYLSKGLWDQAEEDFRKSIELNPQYDGGYNGLGMVSYLKGQYDSAFEDFTRAIDLNPDNAGSFVNRGHVYLKRDKKGLARADFLEACRLGSESGCKAAQSLSAL